MELWLGTCFVLDICRKHQKRSTMHFLRLLKLIPSVKCPFAVKT